MRSESLSRQTSPDNELDIHSLCCALWQGKAWIVSMALLFMVVTLCWCRLSAQQWSVSAITDRPGINMLSGYYTQQQFIFNQDVNDNVQSTQRQSEVADNVYQEFLLQLSAWDTRRDFWLQSDFYRQRKSDDAKANATLLNTLINSIQFSAADNLKKTRDVVRLEAEAAAEANTLLREYVAFANQRAVQHLHEELAGARAARIIQLNAQIKYQEAVATSVFERQMAHIQRALLMAKQQGIRDTKTTDSANELADADLFLLGEKVLEARLKSVFDNGPDYDLNYAQNRAMLQMLETIPASDKQFVTYRYLRTPEEPVNPDSPRSVFLMLMWGAVGTLAGVGVALIRRQRA